MGVNYFTDEQVKTLKSNPNVKSVSNKSITYEAHFKEYFTDEYSKCILHREMFEEVGLSADILGLIRIEQSASRFKKHSERLEGFKDTRLYLIVYK